MQDAQTLPESPPPLNERLEVSDEQVTRLTSLLQSLSGALDNAPVLLSQDATPIAAAGIHNAESVDHLARLAARVWADGADRPARELIRFEEELLGDEDSVDRANLLLYSAHIAGAVTLAVGWQMSISLTQVRAEIADLEEQLASILRS